MVKKRRNNGRNRHGRGHTRLVDCSHCMCKPPKDKAIGRFMVRNMVDAGALNDLKLASAFEGELLSTAEPHKHLFPSL
jgi:small subunit ribosomal protein S26e